MEAAVVSDPGAQDEAIDLEKREEDEAHRCNSAFQCWFNELRKVLAAASAQADLAMTTRSKPAKVGWLRRNCSRTKRLRRFLSTARRRALREIARPRRAVGVPLDLAKTVR